MNENQRGGIMALGVWKGGLRVMLVLVVFWESSLISETIMEGNPGYESPPDLSIYGNYFPDEIKNWTDNLRAGIDHCKIFPIAETWELLRQEDLRCFTVQQLRTPKQSVTVVRKKKVYWRKVVHIRQGSTVLICDRDYMKQGTTNLKFTSRSDNRKLRINFEMEIFFSHTKSRRRSKEGFSLNGTLIGEIPFSKWLMDRKGGKGLLVMLYSLVNENDLKKNKLFHYKWEDHVFSDSFDRNVSLLVVAKTQEFDRWLFGKKIEFAKGVKPEYQTLRTQATMTKQQMPEDLQGLIPVSPKRLPSEIARTQAKYDLESDTVSASNRGELKRKQLDKASFLKIENILNH